MVWRGEALTARTSDITSSPPSKTALNGPAQRVSEYFALMSRITQGLHWRLLKIQSLKGMSKSLFQKVKL